MAIVHRLTDFDTGDYKLIAIHSSRKEDFKVVYLINTLLEISLARQELDVEIINDEGQCAFSVFEYEDLDHHVLWKVVSNKTSLYIEDKEHPPLFYSDPSIKKKQVYLFPEFKTVDYLIKIEDTNEQFAIGTIIERLNTQNIFTTAYEIRQTSIKSKQNLIF